MFSSGKSVTLKAGRSENLDVLMSGFSKDALPVSVTNNLQFTDKLLYIYTSGTTGLPKAAVIKNSRLALFKNIFQQLIIFKCRFYFYCGGVYYMNAMYNLKRLGRFETNRKYF